MSEWGRLQDSLHDHFDEQGVTGVDVDKLIEHLVNVRDFFPGLLGAGRSSDPEPAPPPDDRDWTAEFHALDDAINERLRAGAVPALQATGEPPSDRITITPDIEGDARRISESLNDMLRGAGATGEGELHD